MNSGNIDKSSGDHDGIDSFLSDCLRAALLAHPMPTWPAALDDAVEPVVSRLAFHGIAPFLSAQLSSLSGWPAAVVHEIRKTGGLLSFWEAGHRQAIGTLVAGFDRAGMRAVITKGTAIAYSVYPQALMRQRGDTDIAILGGDRATVRAVLKNCGFLRAPAPRALQEDWHYASAVGISHAVDVHWRLNASARVTRCLEQASCFGEWIDLPGLAPTAKGMGPVGNVILTCINRHSHGTMGYHVGHDKLFDSDRLIWALDLYLLTRSFCERDWTYLAEQARQARAASIVSDGLNFAQRMLGAQIPPTAAMGLQHDAANEDVADYFATGSGIRRLWSDVTAMPGLRDKARIAYRAMEPGDAFFTERFPDAKGWPRAALHIRRWVEGASKLARGRA